MMTDHLLTESPARPKITIVLDDATVRELADGARVVELTVFAPELDGPAPCVTLTVPTDDNRETEELAGVLAERFAWRVDAGFFGLPTVRQGELIAEAMRNWMR